MTGTLLLLALSLPSASAMDPRLQRLLDADGWQVAGDAEHDLLGKVVLSLKDVDGTQCLKGTATVQARGPTMLAVVQDIPSALSWSTAGLTDTRVLGQQGARVDYLQVLDVPDWTMAADRYWVLRGRNTWGSDGSASYRYERTDPTAWPRVAEVLGTLSGTPIEPPTNYGRWTFTPAGGQTQVEYRSCAVFGGVVPAAIQSWIALQQLPATMEDLVREAGRR